MQFFSRNKPHSGFTLMEIMIVIAVLGVLISALIPGYSAYIQRGRDSARMSDISDLSKALTVHFTEYDRYPESDANGCVDDAALLKYLENIPKHDPIDTRWAGCGLNGRYGYATSTGILNNPNVFSLLAVMEQPYGGNYTGELQGFTGTLTASAYYSGINLTTKGAGPFYIRIP